MNISVLLLKIKRMLLTSKLNRSDWIVGYECNKKNKSFYDIIKEFLLGIRDNGLSYVFRRKYYLLPSYLERIITSRYVLTPKPSMGSFLALEEVMNNLDYLFEKRNFIQSRRKRSDKEIFKLFRDPFNSQYDEEEYMQAMKNLIKIFKLDEIFSNSG